MESDELLEACDKLACDILEQARSALMLTLRFMDAALWKMPLTKSVLPCALSADGYNLYYDPIKVIARYKESPVEIIRDLLHVVLHSVFLQPFEKRHAHEREWDVACDVTAEAISMELIASRYPSKDDADRKRLLRQVENAVPSLTASRIYRLFVPISDDVSPKETADTTRLLDELEALFKRDDHSVWTCVEEHVPFSDEAPDDELVEREIDLSSLGDKSSSDDTESEDDMLNNDERVTDDSFDDIVKDLEEAEESDADDSQDLMWKGISKQIELEIEDFQGRFGSVTGNLLVNLSVANRKKCDYREFLRRFATYAEELKVSTEEFDYVYYTYGLKLYHNMPLVEPLEYQESDRVRDFVIAIDTSGSCAGELVRRFVEKTYDVLKYTCGFGRKVNVHVVQCDKTIREDTKITNIRDLELKFKNFETRGYGGTDFEPVFKYVDELIALREFTRLKGLIYLTDGMGDFPEKPPEYETVFVFVDEEQANRAAVPPWAFKVVMSEDDILEL